MKYPVPALGPGRRYARPRGEVHLVLVICLDWLSLPRKSVEMTTRQAARFKHFPSIREKRKEDCLEHTAPSFLALGRERKR